MIDLTVAELENMEDGTLLRTVEAYLITAWTLADRQDDPRRGYYLKAAMVGVQALEKRIF